MIESELIAYMTQGKQFTHPSIVVSLLSYESNYAMFKHLMLQYRMPSQVVTVKNVMKFNYSKASNILKQMNSKIGGDLYNMKFP